MKKNKLAEIGSEFHWAGIPKGPFLEWRSHSLFLALGREAVLALWRKNKSRGSRRSLFVPDYFCPDVSKFWKDNGIKILKYEDDPRWAHPDWRTLRPACGDFVLALNYFGVREGAVWKEWHKSHPRVLLIEDHSHDPFSVWAKNSSADYAFASLRKIFPAPDGAILWSARRHHLPLEPNGTDWTGSALKLSGMIWKKEYFDQGKIDPELKSGFRRFQLEGEKVLSNSRNLSISPWSRSLFLNGFPESWREQRKNNVSLLLSLFKKNPDFKPLFTTWPRGACPFNPVLVFRTPSQRDAFRSKMISKGIFTPVHWALDSTKDSRACDLSRRILTIPADQRYNAQDMRHIAGIINRITG